MSGMSRRTFLKGASAFTAGVAGTAAGGILPGLFSTAYAEGEPTVDTVYGGKSDMKITKVTPILCASRWCLVKVETDAGITGWGECGSWAWQSASAECVRILGSLLEGRDPFQIEKLWNAMIRTPHQQGAVLNSAISAIDIALWDIKGRALGVPIYELLGGSHREKIDAYETISGANLDEKVADAKRLVAEGWRHLRVRPESNNGTDNMATICQKNEELFAALRDTVGYGIDLSIEMHRQVKPVQAIELGKRLDKYMVHFIEDPVLDHPEEVRYVTERCPAPIANGERCFNIYQLADLCRNTNVAYLRPDFCVIGGITAGMKIAHIAEGYGVGIIPHNPLGPISTIAALHIDRVAPNFECQEWPGTFGDFNAMIKGDTIRVENGYIIMPEGPGLGIELVDDIETKFPFGGMKPSWRFCEDGSVRDT